jgi:hypothetical protein
MAVGEIATCYRQAKGCLVILLELIGELAAALKAPDPILRAGEEVNTPSGVQTVAAIRWRRLTAEPPQWHYLVGGTWRPQSRLIEWEFEGLID